METTHNSANGEAAETPTQERSGSDLAILDHFMACGEIVAAQMPSGSVWSPEKRLAAAVLAAALVEVRDHSDERAYRRRVAEDLAWIASSEEEWPFSFLRLCQVFGLDPEWVRGLVARWQKEPDRGLRRQFSTYRHAA